MKAPSHFFENKVGRSFEAFVQVLVVDGIVMMLWIFQTFDYEHEEGIKLDVGVSRVVNMEKGLL